MDYCIQHQTTHLVTTWQAFFTSRESPLETVHAPLTCLSKGCMNIAYPKKEVAYIVVKAPCYPPCHWTNKRAMCIPGLGKSLIHANLFIKCKNCAVKLPSAQLLGEFTTPKKTLPSGPYANMLFTMVSQSYPQ
jgi:hypothetical protein